MPHSWGRGSPIRFGSATAWSTCSPTGRFQMFSRNRAWSKQPFYGGYGLIAEDGLPKPAFNAFGCCTISAIERSATDSKSALVTRRNDGTLEIAAWNLFLPEDAGQPKNVTLALQGSAAKAHRATIYRLDATHGSLLAAYRAMGESGLLPIRSRLSSFAAPPQLPAPESKSIVGGQLTLMLPPQGFALIELR